MFVKICKCQNMLWRFRKVFHGQNLGRAKISVIQFQLSSWQVRVKRRTTNWNFIFSISIIVKITGFDSASQWNFCLYPIQTHSSFLFTLRFDFHTSPAWCGVSVRLNWIESENKCEKDDGPTVLYICFHFTILRSEFIRHNSPLFQTSVLSSERKFVEKCQTQTTKIFSKKKNFPFSMGRSADSLTCMKDFPPSSTIFFGDFSDFLMGFFYWRAQTQLVMRVWGRRLKGEKRRQRGWSESEKFRVVSSP